VCVILDSTGGLLLRTGEKSIKEMLNDKMRILREKKSVNEIREIHWCVSWNTSNKRIGKPKANHCLETI
jgi:hypothetical protein